MLSTERFRIYANQVVIHFPLPLPFLTFSQDIIGVELGGALKNPLAIGAGLFTSILIPKPTVGRNARGYVYGNQHYLCICDTKFNGAYGVVQSDGWRASNYQWLIWNWSPLHFTSPGSHLISLLFSVALVPGDLMLTAFGEMSRNRTFGKKLAQ
jgi:hypothetical protein